MTILDAAVSDRADELIAESLFEMFRTKTSMRENAEVMHDTVIAYVAVLRDLPPWAVNEACQRFARGRVPGHNAAFAPAAAEIHREARHVREPYNAELAHYTALLAGIARDAEPRADLSKRFDDLRAEVVKSMEMEKSP